MNKLRPTKKQQQLLQFIADFIDEKGYSPSYREIMAGCNYNSVATVAKHVKNLISRGHLEKRSGSARSLEIVGGALDTGSGATHKQWLCNHIDDRLSSSSVNMDDVYVLVGALKVLGFDEELNSYAQKIKER